MDIEDLTAWTAHGTDYGLSTAIRAALADPGVGELGDFVHGIPTGYEQAVYGDPRVEVTVRLENNGSLTVATTGCFGQAVQELYGSDVEAYTRTSVAVRPLREELLTQVAADGEVEDATKRWSQCMNARGYSVTTPADLPVQLQAARRDLLLHKQDGTKATNADLTALAETETALADADRNCKDTSALGSVLAQALVEHWAPLASAHAEDLAAYWVMTDHARDVAAEVNPAEDAARGAARRHHARRRICPYFAMRSGGERIAENGHREELLDVTVIPRWGSFSSPASEIQVQPQGVVEGVQRLERQPPQRRPQAIDRHGADLLRLSLGVEVQSGVLCREEHLEGKHLGRVAGHRDHGDHSSPQTLGDRVGPVVADHDRRSALVRLAALDRVEIDEAYFSAAHQRSPSVPAPSHTSRSPESSQSFHAAA